MLSRPSARKALTCRCAMPPSPPISFLQARTPVAKASWPSTTPCAALKFFPAEPAGGTPYLSSLSQPIPQVKFCPTGGITVDTAPRYLKLSNVITLGGSWMAPKAMVQAGDWAGIEALAKAAAALR